MIKNFFVRTASIAAIAALAPVAAVHAQVTTSSARGVVTDSAGQAVAGATVTIVHEPTGTVTTATTGLNGQYTAQNLRIGGPFSVTVTGEGVSASRVENVYTSLGDTSVVNIVTAAADDTARLDTVVVTGAAQIAQVATGPSSTFNLATLENSPAINRDVKDIIRLDPRVYIDPNAGGAAGSDGIQCAGASTRYNSLTVDGVRLNDNFGLNTNGYPTERIPFSYDAIEQVSVELAPFDVLYGSFTACNINAVTKGGTNEIHGGLFYDYSSDALTGDSTDGIERDLGDFDEKRYGIHVGAPIIKDKLFIFGAYEKYEGANIFGQTSEDVGISQALYDSIIATAVNQYGYVSGGLPTSAAVEDEKIFAKIDWNITDTQRAEFTYTQNEGNNFFPSDSSSSQIADGNHYYQRTSQLESYTAALFSDWTPNFNTELRASKLQLDNSQVPVAGYDAFGEVQIRVTRDLFPGTTTIYLGADDSRHSNKLNYDLMNYKAAANWQVGDHLLTAGVEREEFEVFNLFVQQSLGEWRFASQAAFAAGDYNFFNYTNSAGTNDPNDAAASFGYEITTGYLQDNWQITDNFDITAGIRYDYYTTSDSPAYNAAFETRYGFRNDETLDGEGIIQPRIGFNLEVNPDVKFHGGVGLFSGGNPNVWLSNNYSNNGVILADYVITSGNVNTDVYPTGGSPFFDVPQTAIDFVTNASGVGNVNALDPDFKIPSEWKVAFGGVFNVDTGLPLLGDDLRVQADMLLSKTNESAIVVPLGYVQSGVGPDGRPIYRGTSNTNDFMLTNAENKGSAKVYSIAVSKDYDNGFDWSLGYAYTDAVDTNPMTSSVAFSNFSNFATFDAVNIPTATTDYEVAHRFTLKLDYEHDFIGDYTSRISLFGSANEGAPYSYTFARNTLFEPNSFANSRQLAYIPTGVNDPLIAAASNAAAVAALNDFIASHDILNDYRGQIAPRNIAADDWWTTFDLRLSQDLPGLRKEDHTQVYMVIENLGNLINDEWGISREHGFPGNAELYTATINGSNQYVISAFNSAVDNDAIVVDPSLWKIRFGIKYKF
ncbi:MAG: TonB-dependent receptor [Acidobacteria bacterium]|jgi:outer membrane receptor for ferrienterochelin and colicin|nr:TonB-dependent receptor [Acidobacteriota bacterium]